MNLANGYWTKFSMNFNFINRTFTLMLNSTFSDTTLILNDFSVAPGVNREIFTYQLLFSFYFNVQFYLGGYPATEIPIMLRELERSYIQPYTRDTFKPLYEQFTTLDERLYWSGCLRNVTINSFKV